MNRKTPTKLSIPIEFWDSEPSTEILITRLTPTQAVLARWLKPMGRPPLRKTHVPLNRQEPL